MNTAATHTPGPGPTPPLAPKVSPILAEHLPEVGQFLHQNMNSRFSAQRWVESVTHQWAAVVPNYGMQLREGERLVGVFLAIYSDQTINGRVEHFCNPHSWCVLESHRRHGVGLVLQIIRQPGYHYTMFTPNPTVTQVFRGLKFKDLDNWMRVYPNLPSWRALKPGSFAVSRPADVEGRLTGVALSQYLAHRDIPWLRFTAFGQGGNACLVIYKPIRLKRLPCAWVMHLSDPALFASEGGVLRQHLLGQGFASLRVEERWLPSIASGLAWRMQRRQPKLFLSKTLAQEKICDIYSELMTLDV